MNAMTYKGYLPRVEFDPRDNIFTRHVLGVSDRISFDGETVSELTTDFHEAVSHYLDDCSKTGREPQKAASGKLMLRIGPEVHAAVSIAAAASGKSISQWADEVLDRASQAFSRSEPAASAMHTGRLNLSATRSTYRTQLIGR
jgi:predicted HicB family RNase H-like nuclease